MVFQTVRLHICSVAVLMTLACASAPPAQTQAAAKAPPSVASGNITAEMIGRQFGTLNLSAMADNPEYGYSEESPIQVGGGFGSRKHYAFLNSLAGPKREKLTYERVGSCCGFDAPNSPLGRGMLEVFTISYEGSANRRLYFDWYNEGPLLVPVGLSGKR